MPRRPGRSIETCRTGHPWWVGMQGVERKSLWGMPHLCGATHLPHAPYSSPTPSGHPRTRWSVTHGDCGPRSRSGVRHQPGACLERRLPGRMQLPPGLPGPVTLLQFKAAIGQRIVFLLFASTYTSLSRCRTNADNYVEGSDQAGIVHHTIRHHTIRHYASWMA